MDGTKTDKHLEHLECINALWDDLSDKEQKIVNRALADIVVYLGVGV